MRGEDGFFGEAGIAAEGSPPHARGRRPPAQRRRRAKRITPACAGKTRRSPPFWGNGQDHPRMRGEDNRLILADLDVVGSPPHARGRPSNEEAFGAGIGITPACAGKTAQETQSRSMYWDHPRMRGEDASVHWPSACPAGITPACAGKTVRFPRESGKIFFSLPVFFCSQPSPLGWFLRWVLGLGSSLWKQH